MTVLLTISTTCEPATDLGYLLHKHPARVQSFPQSVGTAHIFYPARTPARCTVALLLEVDPISLVRGRHGPSSDGFALGQYVNDRPYAASSMLAMALKDVFRTALSGRCNARPDLAAAAMPLELHLPTLPCAGGAATLRRIFEPLGWTVAATSVPLDPQSCDWGMSRYLDTHLSGHIRLADALNQLYILLPVLDDAKHYWVSDDEVDKLIRAGGDWLGSHPDRMLITSRYLAHRQRLTEIALARLADIDDADVDELDNATQAPVVARTPDRPVPLAHERGAAVLAAVRQSGARTVGDLGCGEGSLTEALLSDRALERIVATDVSASALRATARRLGVEAMPAQQRARLQLFQSALTYRDDRLAGLDAAVLMEVIEHIDPSRLAALGRTVFGYAAPRVVIVTTPNAEYNVRFPALPAGAMRHPDHRFEWTRSQFAAWAGAVGTSYGYEVRHVPVGDTDPHVGSPTQMAIFSKAAG